MIPPLPVSATARSRPDFRNCAKAHIYKAAKALLLAWRILPILPRKLRSEGFTKSNRHALHDGQQRRLERRRVFFFVNSDDTVNALPADDLTTTVVRMSILSNTIRPLFVPQYDGNEGIFLDIQYHQVRDHGAAAGQSGTHAVKGYWSRSFDSPLVHIPFQPIHLVFPFSGGYV